ncbi:MAG: hypothetical protein QHH24_05330 [Candidatus Bathyarchaeota archaeon]|nr:hypothetical protein [Candidatus Bathyarchaeota archaeon]
MSEIKLSSKEVGRWLENETRSLFVPVHAKAQKLRDEMRKALESLLDSSKMLFENSGKEIEKRNMKTYSRARALNKLSRLFIERFKQINAPEEVSYDSLTKFAQETQRALLITEIDLKNWFTRISPFFIIDRRKFSMVFERAKDALKELNSFIAKEYVKTKTLEETFQLTEKLGTLEQQLRVLEQQKARIADEKSLCEKELTRVQLEMAELRGKGHLGQLRQLETEIEALAADVRKSLQHLQKPFIKLQSLALHGGGSGLMQDESKKLDQYLANPFEALATENEGYPLLKAILTKLDQSMAEKLNLKPDKERKAKQAIENILRTNSLDDLYIRCSAALAKRKMLSEAPEIFSIQNHLSKLKEQAEELEKKIMVITSEEMAAERAYNETVEKIRSCKAMTEKNVLEFLGKRIHVN